MLYFTGGDQPYASYFSLNKSTGALGLIQALDRESLASVQIILKATDDCASGKWEDVTTVTWNVTDPSLLLVHVNIKDLNDNGPKFTRKWFTAGVTRDTQPGEEPVIFLKVCTSCVRNMLLLTTCDLQGQNNQWSSLVQMMPFKVFLPNL